MSNENKRPLPNLNQASGSFSTKKQKGKHSTIFSSIPRAPPRSCPVSRIIPKRLSALPPQAISFRDDSDNSFISESIVYSDKNQETYFNQCFVIEDLLGTGSFGRVCKVRSREDGQIYACKKTHFKYKSETDRQRRMEEVKKLEQLPPHKNCVKFFRAWEEDKHMYVLTEACRTSLSEVICQRHDIPEKEVWIYLTDILQGLQHLHSNNLIHMDLKPDNIFIDDKNLCKIGDFGLVIDISEGYPKEAVDGDPRYLAPECLRNIFRPAADMFSLGITLLELATDVDLPSSGPLWQELRNGHIPEVAQGLSNDLLQLYASLTDTDPVTRISCKEAIALPCVRRKIFTRNSVNSAKKMVYTVQKLIRPLLLVSFYILSVIKSLWQNPPREVSTPKADGCLEAYHEVEHSPDVSFQCEIEDDRGSEDNLLRMSFIEPLNSTPLSTSKYFEGDVSIIHYNSDHSRDDKDVGVMSAPPLSFSPLVRRRRFNQNDASVKKFCQTSRNLLEAFSQLDSDSD